MAVSAFDHPFLSGLLGDEEIASFFTAEAELKAMLAFEVSLARAQAESGFFSRDSADRIRDAVHRFTPDVAALKAATATDGVVVPELVRQLRAAVGRSHGKHVHFGATSQDVIDSALMLRLRDLVPVLNSRLVETLVILGELEDRHGSRPMMSRTRMQAAILVTVGHRLSAWREPLQACLDRLGTIQQDGFPVQFGGAAGTLEKLGDKAAMVRMALAELLGLVDLPQWQSQRYRLVEFAGLLSLISGSLGKIGQDIALMAQDGSEVILSGGGGSSAMPHKQNPVAAEVLVTLARFNATLVSGMHQAMVHEQERSGSAWTLEWMILPQMVAATGASTRLVLELLRSITSMGDEEKSAS